MLPPEEIRVGGRGVYLMRALMDEVEYHREGDVNCVRMKKLLRTHA
jgi:anti-sigma regulatory factor (Ser/Thr protein kinase)